MSWLQRSFSTQMILKFLGPICREGISSDETSSWEAPVYYIHGPQKRDILREMLGVGVFSSITGKPISLVQ